MSVCLLGLLYENENEYMLAEWAFLQARRQLRVREEKELAEKKEEEKKEKERKEKEKKEKEELEEEKADQAEQGETRKGSEGLQVCVKMKQQFDNNGDVDFYGAIHADQTQTLQTRTQGHKTTRQSRFPSQSRRRLNSPHPFSRRRFSSCCRTLPCR